MKQILILILLSNALIFNVLAGEVESVFAEGNKAYKQKEYGKAVELYEQVLAAGYRSAELEYNLGNAWYRSDSPGRAALHYERALILSPGHVEATKNLNFIRAENAADIEKLPDFFLKKWWDKAKFSLSGNSMGTVALVLWWMGLGGIAFRFFAKNEQQKKQALVGGCALLAVSLLPLSLSISRASFDKDSHLAILIQKSAILRTSADDASAEVLTIPEGIKLMRLSTKDGWSQVRLENGEVGWLPEQAIEKI